MSDPEIFPHGEPPAAAQPTTEVLRDMTTALKGFVEWHGGAHVWPCPEDDTCDCQGKPYNDAVNEAIRKAEVILVAPAVALSPTFPIQLNEKQEAVVKLWALPTTPGMWESPETVEFNLRTFARKILAESAAFSPSEEPAFQSASWPYAPKELCPKCGVVLPCHAHQIPHPRGGRSSVSGGRNEG